MSEIVVPANPGDRVTIEISACPPCEPPYELPPLSGFDVYATKANQGPPSLPSSPAADDYYDALDSWYSLRALGLNPPNNKTYWLQKYRDAFVIADGWKGAYLIHSGGCREHYLETGDSQSLLALQRFVSVFPYTRDSDWQSLANVEPREAGLIHKADCDLILAGGSVPSQRFNFRRQLCINHIVAANSSGTGFKCFMIAEVARALLYSLKVDNSIQAEVTALLSTLCDRLWAVYNQDSQGRWAFDYIAGDNSPAKDLNFIICPIFWETAVLTGREDLLMRGDQAFESGVQIHNWGLLKQYNQAFFNCPESILKRQQFKPA